MVGYITILFVFLSAISFFLAPTTYSKAFCVWEMASFLVTGLLFMHHKIRRNGLICFDTFFISSFFLINYAHAVFIYPDDGFLPPFQFRTNNDIIPYSLAVAQVGIALYMLANVFSERELPQQRKLFANIPRMAVNRTALAAFIASMGLFCFVFVFLIQ